MKSNPAVLALADPLGSHTIYALGCGYLKAFDHEAHDGRGEAIFTARIDEALRFNSGNAFVCWTLIPKCRPLRPDGRPNKPLTAFTINIEPYPKGAGA